MAFDNRILLLAAGVLVCGCTCAAAAEPAGKPPIDETRATVSKWVATQELIYKERKSWQQEKEILQSRIELVRKEIAEQEAKLGETRKALGDAASRRAETTGGLKEYGSAAELLARQVAEYEQKIKTLYKKVPDPLREKSDPLFRRIPADSSNTNVSLAERYQNVLGILNEMNRLNGEITVATEVRALSDGKPSEVKTIYVGLAQAYFISARNEAGVGYPGEDGWVWQPRNDIARDVNIAIQILLNTAKPHFIPLPVTIK
jgi:hypothetical protein